MPQEVKPAKPPLEEGDHIFLSCFWDLSSCRSVGGETIGHIPYTSMLTWLDHWHIKGEEAEYYLEIIPLLDRVYVEHVYSKRQESLDKATRGGTSRKEIGSTNNQGLKQGRR